MRKLFTFLVLIAITSFYSIWAVDYVKNVSITNYTFTTALPSFTTANSSISGNNVGGPTLNANGFMYTAASGSGARGTKITNMTDATDRQDSIIYEFDWNPYMILGQANSSGTTGTEPASIGTCIVRGSNDSIVFGLWFERWSLKAGTYYNTETGGRPLGDIHLMNKSTDPYNPVPAKIVVRNVNGADTQYYTNLLSPFGFLDPTKTSFYAADCDSIHMSTDLGATFKMSRWYHIKAFIDFKNQKLIYIEVTERDNIANTVKYTDLPFVNTGAKNVSRLDIAGTRGKAEAGTNNGINTNYQQQFDNFDIYTVREVAGIASVSINYKDNNGVTLKTSRIVQSQEVGTTFTVTEDDKINILYNDEYYLYDATSTDNVVVQLGGSEINLIFKKATPIATVLQINAPSTAEVHNDVTMNFNVKTQGGDIVSEGSVLFFVNNIAKSRVNVDVLGTGSITFPNLIPGEAKINALYVGDKVDFAYSDTVKSIITITPSTSTVKPYPVYFDVCDQPEIKDWLNLNVTTSTARGFSKAFTLDSLPGFAISDTLTQTYKVYYNALSTTYDKIDNAYNRADNLSFPMGQNRPKFVKMKTPWLNKGSYNVYLSHRITSTGLIKITSVTMDNKELYFPHEEMYNRILSSYSYGSNTRRQWNAKAHSGNLPMNYLGSVYIDQSNTHILKIVGDDSGYNASETFDMLQFIPVDADSMNINLTADASWAKKYWPMFDWVGFARQSDFDPNNVPATYADYTNFAIPYQVTDLTDWGTKYSHTIDSVGIKKRTIGTDDYVANYVTVYRAEDKWTRVSEGYADGTTFQYTCDLPQGNYYYETILFTDLADGSQGYRTFINSGTFSVGPGTGVNNANSTKIKVFAANSKLTVLGVKAGATILVTDITGRVIANEVAKSDVYTKSFAKGMYVVKVVSGETVRVKVLVK